MPYFACARMAAFFTVSFALTSVPRRRAVCGLDTNPGHERMAFFCADDTYFCMSAKSVLHRISSHFLRISRSDVVKSSQSYSSGTGAASRAPPVM